MIVSQVLPPAPLAAGDELAPGYEVVEHLSRNEALDVYDVWSEARACRCVAKTLRPDRRHRERPRHRLRLEGELLTALSHPHLVRAYETVPGPDPVLILETVTGETLAALIDRRARRLPAADAAMLGLHLCSALHYLHGAGHLHLDVKPENVVCEAGRAKLIDLSLARVPGPVPRGYGTPGYRPPEQVEGGEVTDRSDVWGVGATLWEALTGEAPGDAGDARDAMPARRLPPALADAIEAALAPRAAERPTVGELAGGLYELA